MAQIPSIDDTYIDSIIKSAGAYNPALNKTQGVKLRELVKLMRDRMEQDFGDIPNYIAGTNVLITGTAPNYTISLNQGRGANQVVTHNENGDILVGRVAIMGSAGSVGDDLSLGSAVQLVSSAGIDIAKAARMQLGNNGDILFKTFTGPGDGTGGWSDVFRINNASGNGSFSGTLTAVSFTQSSLRSLKNDIKLYTANALEKINGIKISSFTYKNDEEKAFKVGFIADDTDPLFSTKNKDTMDIGTTLAVSIKAIQELSAEITKLKDRLNDYEAL